MEMEMHMDSSLYHPRPSPSPAQEEEAAAAAAAFYYYYDPPNSAAAGGFHVIPAAAAAAAAPGTVVMLEHDNDDPAASRIRSRRSGSRPRVRVARKHERHSKIWTAGGMRDRRMRLSMDVARRFFALQDKLRFDKASKTVQWLLDMSKAGIDDLAATTSMSEDGSVLLQDYNVDLQTMADSSSDRKNNKQQQIIAGSRLSLKSNNIINGGDQPSSSIITTTKESRARARERARERTRERNCLRWSSSVPAPLIVNQLQAEASPLPHPSSASAAAAEASAAAASACSYNVVDEQQQDQPWELSGVVFAKPHRGFHSTPHG